ncbi:UNKNOWN [Stylonychia lemnae]|uniref:SCP domain-containing protein n=1 Tax=Stylonychia lemnae TaxID=5949 RepID=A0A078ANE9_STYLE|nr:UNKNOWN [Stylonychia lemnae]|eukprot:CDW83699.1 UNKNOWN [Stylonychia lemnae]
MNQQDQSKTPFLKSNKLEEFTDDQNQVDEYLKRKANNQKNTTSNSMKKSESARQLKKMNYEPIEEKSQKQLSKNESKLTVSHQSLHSTVLFPESTSSRPNMDQVTISINSNTFLSPHQSMSLVKQRENINTSKLSINSANNQSNGETVVFFESDYCSSTMPVCLPSDLNRIVEKPTTKFGIDLNRPSTPNYKPTQNKGQFLQIDGISQGQSSQTSNVSRVQDSYYGKLKLLNLDLDDIIKKYPVTSHNQQSMQKYQMFHIQSIYKKTGLPSAPKSALDAEKEVFMVQNLFRVYKRLLLQVLDEYQDNMSKNQQNGINVVKKEGLSAVIDAIEYVKQSPPLKPFYWNKTLSKVCKLHAQECQQANTITNKTKKGEKPITRMKKYGHVFIGGAQNLFTGIVNNNSKSSESKITQNCQGVIDNIIQQIIDDGVQSRGHRKNILNPAHRTLGVAFEEHKQCGSIIVCNYAFNYKSSKHEDPLKQIINSWVVEEQADMQQQMKIHGGSNYKYRITFSYPYLIKTTTIAKQDPNTKQINKITEYNTQRNAEKLFYSEEDSQ